MERPKTRYAKSGDLNIAYQVIGDGPIDLLMVPGWASHVEAQWDVPPGARFLRRLASFSRLILFDKRGTGMSDRVPDSSLPTIEERMDDVRAVLDAVGSEHASLLGVSEGGPMCLLFAATYPERTDALVLYASYAKYLRSDDYPWAPPRHYHDAAIEKYSSWDVDLEENGTRFFAPSLQGDDVAVEAHARFSRLAASPGAYVALLRMNIEIDVRHALPVVRAPSLVLHRKGDRVIRVENARYLADHLQDAKLVEFEGDDHVWFAGDVDAVADEIEQFLTGTARSPSLDRVLSTVLFTDFVDSTRRAAELGDRRWAELLDEHDSLAQRQVERFRGRFVKSTGDGILATFDGPARAVHCAWALREGLRGLGLDMTAGVHTGEIELRGDDVGGLAVNLASRVESLAADGEILVSSTVTDLVVGSGIVFDPRGSHTLKGVPGEWRLFAVDSI